jgi:hypothetical protein
VIAYHGSSKAFDKFKMPRNVHNLNYGPGIYFATDPKDASEYAGPQVHWRMEDMEAQRELQQDPGHQKELKAIARKHGLKSTVDTRHPNWEKFRQDSTDLEHRKISEKMG